MKIVGVGAALLDYILHVEDAYLETIPGKKYGMELVEYDELIHMIEESGGVPTTMAGGSAANVIKALAGLGHDAHFIGKIGSDGPGELLEEHLETFGVKRNLIYSHLPTGLSLALISNDGKRTMRTYIGASGTFTPDEMRNDPFEGAKHLHIEGYTLQTDPNLTEKAMRQAAESGATISFDLGSFELVEEHREKILHLCDKYIDIIFGNSDEADRINRKSHEGACRMLADLCEIAVIMQGKKGCMVGHAGTITDYPTKPVKPIDTTGAGDFFEAGFLHGYLRGQSIEKCVSMGAALGRAVVLEVGAEIPISRLNRMKHKL